MSSYHREEKKVCFNALVVAGGIILIGSRTDRTRANRQRRLTKPSASGEQLDQPVAVLACLLRYLRFHVGMDCD